ncbi:MAG: histidinol-phosphatase HisJ family protein [Ruminiclostridium sp.]|nr:histidinol-phosphatase HisJ family protein [Ruminiclostridium sp.]
MYYDSHIHSTYSADGLSTLGDYTAAVDSGRISGIGFAEHLDMMPECGSYGWLDGWLDPMAYMAEVKALKDKGYEFYAGCEIDYNKKAQQDVLDHLEKFQYDFTICSIHMIDGCSISDREYIPAIHDIDKLKYLIRRYYEEFRHSLEVDAFDVIGHVGVFKRYLGDAYYKRESLLRLVKEAEYEIARLSAKSGKIIEVNTSGLYSPHGETLPGKAFLELYHSFGGRNVCAGSDAHSCEDAGRGMKEAHKLLKETGFRYIMPPWDRENPVKL